MKRCAPATPGAAHEARRRSTPSGSSSVQISAQSSPACRTPPAARH
jgi:hypothetical protein